MNYKLTLETSDASALARILASIGGVAVAVSVNDDGEDDGAPLNTAAPAVDADGLPWDERIHSSNKQTTDKGVWRKRRGVHPTTIATVEQELHNMRPTVQAGVNAVTAAAPPVMPPMMAPGPGFTPPPAMPQAAPAPMQAPAPAPVPTPAPAAGMGFGEFMAKYTTAVNEGKCTPADLAGYLTAMAINTLGDLNSDPAKTLQLHDWMAGNGKL